MQTEFASAATKHQSELMRSKADAQALLHAEKSNLQKLRGELQQTKADAAQRLSDQQCEAREEKLNQTEEVRVSRVFVVFSYMIGASCP